LENFGNTTPDNGIQIESWYDDLEDRELEKHLIFLKEIAQREVYDVREILTKYKDNMSGLYSKSLSMIASL
jgi:TFIIF-interacting CTD phosphatase-like protein